MIDSIAILGAGLLGTSAGLALRANGFTGQIVGWNRSQDGGRIALELGAFDRLESDAITAARNCQVTILATPVFNILDWMERLATELGPHQLVTDVGSTKGQITDAGNRLFNRADRAGFLPGHPMAGKERGGAALGDATLFANATWIFTDVEALHRSPAATALATDFRLLVQSIGARILDLDPHRHDELVAWVSHMPQFLSTALSALLESELGAAPELNEVGGRALREMTRLGSSPYSMWRDIAYTNTEAIQRSLHALELRIAHLRENLRTPGLRDEFEQANRFRKTS